MKTLFAAVAAAPLLMACASAGALDHPEHAHAESSNVLIINGERIIVRDGEHVVRIIETKLSDDTHGEVEFDFDFEFDGLVWSDEDAEAFEDEMSRLAVSVSDALIAHDGVRIEINTDELEERIELIVEQAERHAERAERHRERAERHAERQAERAQRHAERQAERQARHAERLARHIERQARDAERNAFAISFDANAMASAGLAAAEHGLEAGILALDRTLERGWREEDGERIPLTREERRELRDAREEMQDGLAEIREERRDHEREARARTDRQSREHSNSTYHRRDGDRDVRVIERDGETRVWVNGRELRGAEKETWLEAWRNSEQFNELDGPPTPPRPRR